jgi:hypothetical protein
MQWSIYKTLNNMRRYLLPKTVNNKVFKAADTGVVYL